MNKPFQSFSPKQLAVLTWWCAPERAERYNGIICDGAVRSGKTLCMSISFIAWAMHGFADTSFALCGKTVTSLRRNVVTPLLPVLRALGFACRDRLSRNMIEIQKDGRENRFYLFGGKDESSAALIQGITLGGVLFDEVALMPRSFVEQALSRCSLGGAKFWFNCNPEHPHHWFYTEWICRRKQKKMLYIHFLMEDNPSLSGAVLARYKSLYSGAFYERFVEGKWVAADGLVYPMFREDVHVDRSVQERTFSAYYLSCDYGTVNPFSLGLWGKSGRTWYRIREYYHDARACGVQRTDEEYYRALKLLAGQLPVAAVVVDPSAASFIELIRRKGEYRVLRAENDVLDGIRKVCSALQEKKILFSPACTDTIREFSLYRWDDSVKKDAPRKENDHAMDDIRYFVSTVVCRRAAPAYSLAVDRGGWSGANQKGDVL